MPDDILSQNREHHIADDGNTCNDPRDINEELPYVNYGNLDKEYDRLATFKNFPQIPGSALPRDLASAGFYFTGVRDIVKCFSCAKCVEHMKRQDNPRDRRFHEDDCQHRDGHDQRNVPTSYPPTAGPLQQFLRNEVHGSASPSITNMSNGHTTGRSEEMQQGEENLIIPQQPSESSSDMETQNGNQNAEEAMDTQPPGATGSSGAVAEFEDIYPAFACLDPFHGHLSNQEDRLRTFQPNWQANINATPQTISEAGFFYTNERDRVRCWYCNGCLENWERDDDPWIEHAKWFPQCEFLLRHKGPDLVHEIVSQFPNLSRPGNVPANQPPVAVNPLPEPEPPANPTPSPLAPPRPRPPQNVGPRNIPGPQLAPNAPVNTRIETSGGTVINLVNGQITGGLPPHITYTNNENGGYTINIQRQGPSTTRTIIRGGNNISIIQTGGRGRGRGGGGIGRRLGRGPQPRRPPEFVDPEQDAERHQQTVNETMTNSPLVTNARDMGFMDDVIRVVLLSKFRAGGGMYDNIEDFVEALAEYQTELARLDNNPAPPVEPSPEGGAGSSESGEPQGGASSSETQLRQLEESRNCKMCHREPATVVVMPCAHLALCTTCAERNIRVCPVCRQMVTQTIRSFIS